MQSGALNTLMHLPTHDVALSPGLLSVDTQSTQFRFQRLCAILRRRERSLYLITDAVVFLPVRRFGRNEGIRVIVFAQKWLVVDVGLVVVMLREQLSNMNHPRVDPVQDSGARAAVNFPYLEV